MKRLKAATRRGLRRLWHDETHILEVGQAIFAFTVGFWLLAPSLDTFNSSPTFTVMASRAPENAWGVAIVGVGLFQLIGAFRGILFRLAAAFCASFTWGLVATMTAAANLPATATPVYATISAKALWIVFRLAWRYRSERRVS